MRTKPATHYTDIRLCNNAGINFPICKSQEELLDMDATGWKQSSDFNQVTCKKCLKMAPLQYPWAFRDRAVA